MLRHLVLAAVVSAVALPALADTITGRIVKIDPEKRLITLSDKTVMLVDKKIDLSTVPTDRPVVLSTSIDENGIAPINAIQPKG